MLLHRYCFIVLFTCFIAACSKDYIIDLPPNKSELVVECYLEDGQPIRALVTETQGLLDTNTYPPLVLEATVIVSYQNKKDTLRQLAVIDTIKHQAFNYSSNNTIQANYGTNEAYRIDVYDTKGRHAYANTHFIPPVAIDSLQAIFNSNNEAYCLTKFKNSRTEKSYFRLILNKNSLYDSTGLDVLLDNNFSNDNNELIYGSGYDYKRGDTINARLFHLTYDFYQYLNTTQNARAALVNPFAVSGEIVSNIIGGRGIFTTLNYHTKQVIVR